MYYLPKKRKKYLENKKKVSYLCQKFFEILMTNDLWFEFNKKD